MIRRIALFAAGMTVLASPTFAQGKVEVSAYVGWTVSEGVGIINGLTVNGATYTTVDPKDSQAFGFTFGGYLTPKAEIEFLWSRQQSALEVTGKTAKLVGNMNVDNYHGNFVFHLGNSDTLARPFIFGGAGMTSYGDATFPGATINGLWKFSWAVGGGIKVFPSPRLGVKAMVRWTPTYIKSMSTGWWCDPWYGCVPSGVAYYANQIEFSGGIVARF